MMPHRAGRIADPIAAEGGPAGWWSGAALALIVVHATLLLAQWPLLPKFLDSYYHLNVARGFAHSGGVVLWESWEFAPIGRPHLYPPAVHLVLAGLQTAGLDVITIARLAAVATYPALILATWWCAREWMGREAAYWVAVCSLAPHSYLLVACNTIAASWAAVWWMASLVAIHRHATVAGILAGALGFYTHLGMPWLMMGSWVLLAWGEPARRRVIARMAIGSLLLAAPWLAHVGIHRDAFGPMSSLENEDLEVPLLLAGFGIAWVGMLRRVPRPPGAWFAASVWLSLSPMLAQYRFRFFSGQGLMGLALIAGSSLAMLRRGVTARWPAAWSAAWIAVMTAAMLLGHVTVATVSGRWEIRVADSALANLAGLGPRTERASGVSLYVPHLVDPLVQIVRAQSSPDEILGCNLPYSCGMVGALADRALATGMFAEARAASGSAEDALRRAHLLVWFKTAPPPELPALDALRARWGLLTIGETPTAWILRNPGAGPGRRRAHPVVPLGTAQAMLAVALVLAAVDLRRHKAAQPAAIRIAA